MLPFNLINKWLRDRLSALGREERLMKKAKMKLDAHDWKDSSRKRDPISMRQLQAAFYLLILGYMLAAIAFLNEILSRNKIQRNCTV